MDLGETVRRLVEEAIPFNRFLGIVVTHLEPGTARFEVPFRPELIGDPVRRVLHGGVLSAVFDACGGAAVWSKMTLDDRISTIDLRVDYLRPARAERFVAEATVVRLGNRVAVVDARAFQEEGGEQRLIATGKCVYSIYRGGLRELRERMQARAGGDPGEGG